MGNKGNGKSNRAGMILVSCTTKGMCMEQPNPVAHPVVVHLFVIEEKEDNNRQCHLVAIQCT